jgi:hypothetical protein
VAASPVLSQDVEKKGGEELTRELQRKKRDDKHGGIKYF